MNIMLAEKIIKLYQGIINVEKNLSHLTINHEMDGEITGLIKVLEKSLGVYQNQMSNFLSLNANQEYNEITKYFQNEKTIEKMQTILKHVNVYIEHTNKVMRELQIQTEIFKKEWINAINQIDTYKKKVVILGISELTVNIKKILNEDKVQLIAYCTTDEKYKWNRVNEIPIIDIEELSKIEYDLLIIAEKNTYIENNKTLNLIDYIDSYYDYEISRAAEAYLHYDKEQINGLITGSSYAETAIDVEQIKGLNFVNLAVSSQDLYYDYEIVRWILSNKEIDINNFKYVIINLGYASFQYDLSLSVNKHRTSFYYPYIKKLHHNFKTDTVNKYDEYEYMSEKVFIKNFHSVIHKILQQNNDKMWEKLINGEMKEPQIQAAGKMVGKDCNKYYPLTVNENVDILTEYIELLLSKRIIPLITICPTSKYYSEKFSNRIKTEFKEIIEGFIRKYKLKVLDYFDSSFFYDSDFYDVSHLNRKGSIKFTKLISEELKRLESGNKH
ncbi:hypothetical protein IUK39_11125 [Priestia aryabhattai]|uniref:hypothetical protein n=1 Tax=Priestia aryabhattai TaxID=412384 RepID=UPI001C0C12C0|nr:hypothetical protein [Priestia aryabhattai]MBU3570721.1 hypothetical protein [Priestia aryabhattai]